MTQSVQGQVRWLDEMTMAAPSMGPAWMYGAPFVAGMPPGMAGMYGYPGMGMMGMPPMGVMGIAPEAMMWARPEMQMVARPETWAAMRPEMMGARVGIPMATGRPMDARTIMHVPGNQAAMDLPGFRGMLNTPFLKVGLELPEWQAAWDWPGAIFGMRLPSLFRQD